MPRPRDLRDPGLYAQCLRRMERYYAAREPPLQSQRELRRIVPDLFQRRRVEALESDLRALGVEPLAPMPAPEPLSVAEALGALYVIEGSTLGGQVIMRSLQGTDFEAGATRFFDAYGPRTGAMWKAFCGALEAFGAARQDDIPFVLAGARRCFGAFQTSLSDDSP
jgi:heme oxygenase